MNKIILVYNQNEKPLGHEIHRSRIILLDLLCKNYINCTDYVVTSHDRKFLYDKIFINVIENHEYDEMDKTNFTIIDLRPYAELEKIPELLSINYNLRHNNYCTDEFIKICLNINFYDDETIYKFGFNFINNEQYIMIHHRYNAPIDILINLLNNIRNIKPQIKIIIFNSFPNDLKTSLSSAICGDIAPEPCTDARSSAICGDIAPEPCTGARSSAICGELQGYTASLRSIRDNLSQNDRLSEDIVPEPCSDAMSIYNDIYIINDLRLYASLLHNLNCKILIGEWSGGTQLAQYCFNGIILYYFNTYTSYTYIDIYKDLIKITKNDIFDAWDFKNFTNNIIYMYKNMDDLINNINLYI